ncbi:MAG: 23S rRNA (uridine(2552)-2'-O)-methyltransferase [Candidatus Sedimenticola endophacoides]|uniref:Ribosomal RNA large subunit methyltransferase E n=1 Tax=Candidatus Sedimenticola endophacoides TaxID=2548426 RepID=A0A657PL60_9GAMM|nr:MAG: 23S rRNA (uridine(2552)-2'-O)-methyltransferase [Candidatus Sedimenticola endophacoides]OQX35450.1 MAG: 23S rRNA (uridine(2552)-2'-O)-methyltransferase [Candidatus Sedimenticola endophacoides]OQX36672.1 MAG: 23S rRNA (uridine(2552)-2'-O)-methyltransferase [Candidatus Sedimenticola endophacoides]OQX40903.1 MAG: 23S rRNA (uridine(2552)-2'-O)-methyltransferase [Candidatus Sedimenticola endophacoides]OQX47255.1 MAG: 23S rRNA (uridine(2552)-2'-O)-methyltransferase [Candidatus Sedimenticola e
MKKRKSSRAWIERHLHDEYVKRAQAEGYRSRAAYKLLELQEKDQLFRPAMVVVDLGAAPGGWSQVAERLVGERGRVFAMDILPMDSLAGVDFLQGDFLEEATLERLLALLAGRGVDLVISDMAPNVSGVSAVDQPRAMHLCDLALDFAHRVLRPGGGFAVKVFQGEGFDDFVREVRGGFARVVIRKPRASRPKSREVYVVAGNYNP